MYVCQGWLLSVMHDLAQVYNSCASSVKQTHRLVGCSAAGSPGDRLRVPVGKLPVTRAPGNSYDLSPQPQIAAWSFLAKGS